MVCDEFVVVIYQELTGSIFGPAKPQMLVIYINRFRCMAALRAKIIWMKIATEFDTATSEFERARAWYVPHTLT